jgi:hypothetical protein
MLNLVFDGFHGMGDCSANEMLTIRAKEERLQGTSCNFRASDIIREKSSPLPPTAAAAGPPIPRWIGNNERILGAPRDNFLSGSNLKNYHQKTAGNRICSAPENHRIAKGTIKKGRRMRWAVDHAMSRKTDWQTRYRPSNEQTERGRPVDPGVAMRVE